MTIPGALEETFAKREVIPIVTTKTLVMATKTLVVATKTSFIASKTLEGTTKTSDVATETLVMVSKTSFVITKTSDEAPKTSEGTTKTLVVVTETLFMATKTPFMTKETSSKTPETPSEAGKGPFLSKTIISMPKRPWKSHLEPPDVAFWPTSASPISHLPTPICFSFALPDPHPAAELPVRGITNSLNVARTASIVLYELLAR